MPFELSSLGRGSLGGLQGRMFPLEVTRWEKGLGGRMLEESVAMRKKDRMSWGGVGQGQTKQGLKAS